MSACSYGEESTPLHPVQFHILSLNTLQALPLGPLSVMHPAMVLASASFIYSATSFPLRILIAFQPHSNFYTHLRYGQCQTLHRMNWHLAHSFQCRLNLCQSMLQENILLPYEPGTLPKVGLPPFQKTATPGSTGLCAVWTTYSVLAAGPSAHQSHLT